MLSVAFSYAAIARFEGSTQYFLIRQDLPFLVLFLALIPALAAVPALRWPPLARSFEARPMAWTVGLAGVVVVAGAGFGPLVTHGGYVLSTDEFLANFDATIFARGQLMAPVPPAWRDYLSALQPSYTLTTPGGAQWASGYLPVNAAMRALALKAGALGLVNPLLSGVGVLATYGVGRRLWPSDARPALIAAALTCRLAAADRDVDERLRHAGPLCLQHGLAAWPSSLCAAARLGHGCAALLVGFLACGLHQLAFHPLFAAPFVLQLWLDRRWRLAGLYTLAYAGICLFWIEYWPLEQRLIGVPSLAAKAAGGGFFLQKVLADFGRVSFGNLGAMAESLLRFITWQAPLTAPLFIVSAGAALSTKGPLRALALGVLLTLLLVLVVTPSQVHGWGYRYLHGLLGSIGLIAAWGWTRLTRDLAAPRKAAANAALAASCALSLLVFAPIRAWQAWSYTRPYAAANAAIQQSRAPVVIVANDGGAFFDTGAVMRNDPFLVHAPKVLLLYRLDAVKVAALCRAGPVAVFDGADGARLGMDVYHARPPIQELLSRGLMSSMGCGVRVPSPLAGEGVSEADGCGVFAQPLARFPTTRRAPATITRNGSRKISSPARPSAPRPRRTCRRRAVASRGCGQAAGRGGCRGAGWPRRSSSAGKRPPPSADQRRARPPGSSA